MAEPTPRLSRDRAKVRALMRPALDAAQRVEVEKARIENKSHVKCSRAESATLTQRRMVYAVAVGLTLVICTLIWGLTLYNIEASKNERASRLSCAQNGNTWIYGECLAGVTRQ